MLEVIQQAVSCDGCGACCLAMRTPPFIDWHGEDERYNALPQGFKDEMRRTVMDDRPDSSPCSWLDLATMRCRHYDLRPDICREFEVGEEACLGWREEFGIA